MKRIMLLLMLSLTVILTTVTYASDTTGTDIPIDITVNGNYIQMDSEPFLDKDITYVPVRFISEALSADRVEWDSINRTAIIVDENLTIKLPVSQKGGFVNGTYVAIKDGIKLINDRTYVPIRFVAEHMGCNVGWNTETLTVEITKDGTAVPNSAKASKSYTQDDIYWLAKIIHAESAAESMKGKIAVGNVILNRVASKDYPNTIYEVIFDKKYGVQFEPTLNGTIYNKASADCVIAAKRALRGENVAGDCLFFLNPKIAQSFWIVNYREHYETIGNHEFYL